MGTGLSCILGLSDRFSFCVFLYGTTASLLEPHRQSRGRCWLCMWVTPPSTACGLEHGQESILGPGALPYMAQTQASKTWPTLVQYFLLFWGHTQ